MGNKVPSHPPPDHIVRSFQIIHQTSPQSSELADETHHRNLSASCERLVARNREIDGIVVGQEGEPGDGNGDVYDFGQKDMWDNDGIDEYEEGKCNGEDVTDAEVTDFLDADFGYCAALGFQR